METEKIKLDSGYIYVCTVVCTPLEFGIKRFEAGEYTRACRIITRGCVFGRYL